MMLRTRCAGLTTLGLVLVVSGAVSANEAVESLGVVLDVPAYDYSVSSRSGWRDQPRTQRSSLGGRLSGVMPVAREFGARLAVFGGAARAKSDPAGTISSNDFVGSVGTAISGFWRNSDRAELGLGYSVDFGFNPVKSKDRSQRVGVFGAFFIQAVDLRIGIDYQRWDETNDFTSLGVPFTFDSTANGVNVNAGVTWYSAGWLSTSLDATYGHSRSDQETPFGPLSMKGDVGSFFVRASVLPPLAGRNFVVLDGWLGYARSRTRPDGPVNPGIVVSSASGNNYQVGVSLRFVLPGVESLAELRRRY